MSGKQPERDVGPPLFLTYKEAARKINVSVSWIYHLLRTGELTRVELGPQVCRIPTDECEAYAARRIAASKAKSAALGYPAAGSSVTGRESAA